MQIQISDDTTLTSFDYASGGADADSFAAAALRDADSSFTASNPVMTAGDLIRLDVDLVLASMEFPVREDVRIVLLPEVGSPQQIGFTTPNSYGTRLVMELA